MTHGRERGSASSGRQVVLATKYYTLSEDAARRLVILKRNASPIESLVELRRENDALIEAFRREHSKYGIVVDMRDAPFRPDKGFEDAMSALRHAVGVHFARVVVLVQSAVGALQVSRMHREAGHEYMSTQNEAEAFRFASEPPLPSRRDR